MMQDLIQHGPPWWVYVIGTGSVWSIAGHMVNTFPPPENPYGRWFIGCLQYIVGQRIQSLATRENTTVAQKVANAVLADPQVDPRSVIATKSAELPEAKKDS